MAGVQDPAFWKRFSVAAHLHDEEKVLPLESRTNSSTSSRPVVKHTYVAGQGRLRGVGY